MRSLDRKCWIENNSHFTKWFVYPHNMIHCHLCNLWDALQFLFCLAQRKKNASWFLPYLFFLLKKPKVVHFLAKFPINYLNLIFEKIMLMFSAFPDLVCQCHTSIFSLLSLIFWCSLKSDLKGMACLSFIFFFYICLLCNLLLNFSIKYQPFIVK